MLRSLPFSHLPLLQYSQFHRSTVNSLSMNTFSDFVHQQPQCRCDFICRLLPALLRFAEPDAPRQCQAEALRFVEFCIHHMENDDPAIHHLAVRCNPINGCMVQAQSSAASSVLLLFLAPACCKYVKVGMFGLPMCSLRSL